MIERSLSPRRRKRGFTAIELTAVASIIAILALILMPIVRKRVAQARFTAAQDDMRTIEIAQTFSKADTGHHVRLIDLDNGPYDDSSADPDLFVPRAFWNKPISTTQFTAFRTMWDGPYTTFNSTKFLPIDQLWTARPAMFRLMTNPGDPDAGVPPSGTGEGPILLISFSSIANADDFADVGRSGREGIYPIDPWGSPYIFFGNEPIGALGGRIAILNESNFAVASVYSMGPDGVPGSNSGDPTNSAIYFREIGVLGGGDDLVRRF